VKWYIWKWTYIELQWLYTVNILVSGTEFSFIDH
jgi:hypothetical protein